MQNFKYLSLQFKRITKLLPSILAMIIVLAVILSLAGYATVKSGSFMEEQQKYKLGVVGDTDNEMISLGIYMLKTLDETRYMIELVQYDSEAAARDAMRKADISAYIVITEEFSNALNAMTNDEKLSYYATSGQKGISNVMMDEIASIATNIIVSSEKGICTLREIMLEEGYDKAEISESVNELFMVYIASLMTRTEVIEIKELGLSDGLSTPAYYFTGILLFFILLLSFCAISYFLGQKNAKYQFMAAKGIRPANQVLIEYIPFLVLNLICTAITLILLYILLKIEIFTVEEFAENIRQSMLRFSACLIPVVIMFSAFGFFIFGALEGVINKILLAFMLYMAMGYVSGYFYPKTFFPEIVQKIGECIPSGLAFSYMGAVVTSEKTFVYILPIAAYSIAFLLLSVLARKSKLK